MRFLTREWGAALEAGANASEPFRKAAQEIRVTIGQEVGEIRYSLAIDAGVLKVRWDDGAGADVTFVQDRETAERISRGEINAQQAFVLGKLRVRGDLGRLTPARDAFLELETALAELRTRTEY